MNNVWYRLFCTKFLSIFMNIPIEVQKYTIFRFKDFGMINLHYEFAKKSIIVTTHKSKCLVRNSLHQTLHWNYEKIKKTGYIMSFRNNMNCCLKSEYVRSRRSDHCPLIWKSFFILRGLRSVIHEISKASWQWQIQHYV